MPLWRAGFPIFDRLGASHRVWVGYAGTRERVFEVAKLLAEHGHHPTPESMNPFTATEETRRHGHA